jgi:hypothetical protein
VTHFAVTDQCDSHKFFLEHELKRITRINA